MSASPLQSWGRVPGPVQRGLTPGRRDQALPLADGDTSLLAFGNGRSYGDSNLNPGGVLLTCRALDRFIAFCPDSGRLRCEAGVLLSEILDLVVPQGWFLAVTPGTRHVTVGGAIANDVHGKNHHRAGSFGNHVTAFELLRSDGSRRLCTPDGEHADWFSATVGGLGLTGLITWAELRLRRIANPCMDAESIKFDRLEDFFDLSDTSARDHEYTVAWIDCASAGSRLGRGLFSRANHAPAQIGAAAQACAAAPARALRLPFTPPVSLVNAASLRAFNAVYYGRQRARQTRALVHYRPFFYPLDAIQNWNLMYGPRGFYQYQSVVPTATARQTTRRMLELIAASGMGSFLAVLKQFGDPPSLGMLSFPSPGTTLALDFPNVGPRLMHLLEGLDQLVLEAGGRLYPAKDGRLPARLFHAGHPRLAEFRRYVDPRFSSGLWRRVTETS